MTSDDLIETRVYQTERDIPDLVSDIVETRRNHSLSMRFPSDADSRKRLQAVIVAKPERVPLWRRVLRWLRGVG